MQKRSAAALAILPVLWLGTATASSSVDPTTGLADSRLEARRDAERALLAGGDRARAAVERALGHHDYRVRRRAVRVLLRAGDPRALPLVAKALAREDPVADIRVALAWTAVRLGAPGAEAIIRSELSSAYWHRRLNAASDLAALEDAGAARWLLQALADPLWLVRLRALRGLVAIDPRPHQNALIDCLSDEEATVRREALQALLALGRPEAAQSLDGAVLQALYDDEAPIRRLAARALSDGVASPGALAPALAFSLVNDEDAEVRALLTRALARDVDDETTELARAALGDRDFAVRAAATGVLFARGEKVGVDLLVRDFSHSKTPRADAQWLAPLGATLVVPKLAAIAAAEGAGPAARALKRLAALGDQWRSLVDERAARWILLGAPVAAAAGAEIAAGRGHNTLAEALVSRLGWLTRAATPAAQAALVRFAPFVRAAAHALAVSAPRIPAGLRGRAAILLDSLSLRTSQLAASLARVLAAGVAPDALPKLARSHSASVRAVAVQWAARLGDAEPLARSALDDPAASVRLAGALALANEPLPAPSDPVASLGALPVSKPTLLGAAVVSALRGRLRDTSTLVRDAAARALFRGGDASGRDEWRASLARRLTQAEAPEAFSAAGDLAELARSGDAQAARLLVPLLVSKSTAVRALAKNTLRELATTTALLEAIAGHTSGKESTQNPRLVALGAAHLLAERGYREGLGATLGPLTNLRANDAEQIGEVSPARLGRALLARIPEKSRSAELRLYMDRVLVPDLLTRWTAELSRDVATRWRGTAPYNMRRQHRYDREVVAAIAEFPGLHPKVLKALLFQESNFERLTGNTFDCVGLAAFCRRAAREESLSLSDQLRDFDHDARYAPAASIRAAVRHLRRKASLLEAGPFAQYGAPTGRDYWAFVLAAYNGGHEQVGAAMEKAYEAGLELAKATGRKGEAVARAARAHAARWDNLLAPEESPEDSPLYQMTKERYGWYRPYGRYKKMSGAEAKYHEIGQFPLDILDRAFEHPHAAPPSLPSPSPSTTPAKGKRP